MDLVSEKGQIRKGVCLAGNRNRRGKLLKKRGGYKGYEVEAGGGI